MMGEWTASSAQTWHCSTSNTLCVIGKASKTLNKSTLSENQVLKLYFQGFKNVLVTAFTSIQSVVSPWGRKATKLEQFTGHKLMSNYFGKHVVNTKVIWKNWNSSKAQYNMRIAHLLPPFHATFLQGVQCGLQLSSSILLSQWSSLQNPRKNLPGN